MAAGIDIGAKTLATRDRPASVVRELAERQRRLSAVYDRLDFYPRSPVETPADWAFVQRLHGQRDIWLREVAAALKPAEAREIKVEVARLLSAYPSIPDAQKAAFGALLAQDMLRLGVSHQVMREAFFEVRRSEYRLCSAQVLSRTDLHTGRLRLLRTMLLKLPVPRFDYLGGAAAREQEKIAAHRVATEGENRRNGAGSEQAIQSGHVTKGNH